VVVPRLTEIPDLPGPASASARGSLSRRGLFGAVGVGAAAVAGAVAVQAPAGSSLTAPKAAADQYPFHGEHQAGIVTPAQDRLHFAVFDLPASVSRQELISLLTDWTAAAARMTAGLGAGPAGPTTGAYDAPPDDTGEAIGLPPAGLTITFGFGPSLFDHDELGIAARRPRLLQRLPHFPGDNLDLDASDGDLCIQACANDPQVAVHAIRNLTRIAFGRAVLRWSQLGFGRTSSTSTHQVTPRNLFGFKDGTANLKAEEDAAVGAHVWVPRGRDTGADWLSEGTFLVARRIAMTIETWDRQQLQEQERVIGRTKGEGAPLSGGAEFTDPDFTLPGRTGPLIDNAAHVRLAHPDFNSGARLLRRGYNFVDGNDALGRLDAGLFFLAFVTDPRTHFIDIQTKLGRQDSMSEYIQHRGSALFAIPGGVAVGEYVGQALFS